MKLESPMTVHAFFACPSHFRGLAFALAAMNLVACNGDTPSTVGPVDWGPPSGWYDDGPAEAEPVLCDLSTTPWVAGESMTVTDYVTSIRSQSDFDLGGRPVRTTADTEFDPPFSIFPDYVFPDVQFTVSGTVEQSGSLVADSVRRGRESPVLVSGPIQEVTVHGRLTVLGFVLRPGPCQRVYDITSSFAAPQRIDVLDLAAGDSVEVALADWEETGGPILRITRRPPDELVEVRGWYAINAREPTFVVNGNLVRVTESTRFFRGHQFFGDGPAGCSCAPADASAFWREVDSGEYALFGVIEVKGVLQAGEISATEIYWYYI